MQAALRNVRNIQAASKGLQTGTSDNALVVIRYYMNCSCPVHAYTGIFRKAQLPSSSSAAGRTAIITAHRDGADCSSPNASPVAVIKSFTLLQQTSLWTEQWLLEADVCDTQTGYQPSAFLMQALVSVVRTLLATTTIKKRGVFEVNARPFVPLQTTARDVCQERVKPVLGTKSPSFIQLSKCSDIGTNTHRPRTTIGKSAVFDMKIPSQTAAKNDINAKTRN